MMANVRHQPEARISQAAGSSAEPVVLYHSGPTPSMHDLAKLRGNAYRKTYCSTYQKNPHMTYLAVLDAAFLRII